MAGNRTGNFLINSPIPLPLSHLTPEGGRHRDEGHHRKSHKDIEGLGEGAKEGGAHSKESMRGRAGDGANEHVQETG